MLLSKRNANFIGSTLIRIEIGDVIAITKVTSILNSYQKKCFFHYILLFCWADGKHNNNMMVNAREWCKMLYELIEKILVFLYIADPQGDPAMQGVGLMFGQFFWFQELSWGILFDMSWALTTCLWILPKFHNRKEGRIDKRFWKCQFWGGIGQSAIARYFRASKRLHPASPCLRLIHIKL